MSGHTFTSADEQALREMTETHIRTGLDGDWAGWAATCTDDCIVLPPDEPPVHGRDAVRRWLEAFPTIREFTGEVQRVEGGADLAYTHGTGHLVADADGETVEMDFKWLAVFRRQDDGSWKMVADGWSPNHPV